MNNHTTAQPHNRTTDYPVKESAPLLPFLMHAIHGLSRTKAKALLTQRRVQVDNVIVTQHNHPLQPGQHVKVSKTHSQHSLNSPWVKLIYEDAHLLVVEKKEGILTNALPGTPRETVKTILDHYVKTQHTAPTVHTVHRLDKGTSGLLLFAKQRDIQQALTSNWRATVTDRRYVAVVQGEMLKDSGTVTSWLTDNKMFLSYSSPVDNGGKHAVTHYRTLQRKNGYTLVELKLETGRKNQIRVHLHDLGHPIVGDLKYGSTPDRYGQRSNPVGRICLHAFRLEFRHPVTGEMLKFETPCPGEFARLLR